MPLPQITVEGNLGADPELRFTPSGAAVAHFRVGTSERKFNQQTQQWEDGRNCWMDVTVWRQLAENVAESLHQGDKVVVTGFLYDDSYERDGQRVTVKKMDGRTVSASLGNAVAQIRKTQRSTGTNAQGQPVWGQGAGSQPAPRQEDPWATPVPAGQQQGQQQGQPWGGAPPYDEPPF